MSCLITFLAIVIGVSLVFGALLFFVNLIADPYFRLKVLSYLERNHDERDIINDLKKGKLDD